MSEAFRAVALAIQRRFNRFDPTAARHDEAPADGPAAPVFVLSPPRSGSTLLYQVLVRTTGVSFISNLMALLPSQMLRLARPSLARVPPPDAPYHPGEYGFVPGLFSPSEAGKVMDRWFDPARVAAHRPWTRRTAAALHAITGRPLVVKALPLALALPVVAAHFPRARLVILTRRGADVVRSIHRGQSDPAVAADRWSGVTPADIPDFGDRHPAHRIAWTVAEFGRRIEEGARLFEVDRVVRVAYLDLCRDPGGTVAAIAGRLGLAVTAERMPAPFARPAGRGQDPALERAIAEACAAHSLAP